MSHCASHVVGVGADDLASRSAGPIDRHFTRRGHGPEFEMEADWVRRRLPPRAERIADVGCGNGALFEAIGPDRVLGIDICLDGLSLTAQRFASVPLVAGDAEYIPMGNATLDAITLLHVVEHIPRFELACAQWHRVLRTGGFLLILTPNASFCDPGIFEDPTHVRLFTHSGLRPALERGGFEIVDLRTLGLPWFRDNQRTAWGWRGRRFIIRYARHLSLLPGLRWKGQTLCCLARKSVL